MFAYAESRAYGMAHTIRFIFFCPPHFSGLAWLLLATIATYKLKSEPMSDKLRKLMFEMAGLLAVLLGVGLLFMSYKIGTGLLDDIKSKPIILFYKRAVLAFHLAI